MNQKTRIIARADRQRQMGCIGDYVKLLILAGELRSVREGVPRVWR